MAEMTEEKIEPTSLSDVDVILQEINDARRRFEKWDKRGRTTEMLYRGEGDGENVDSDKFKILWTITEMQRPLIYDTVPTPVIGPRWRQTKKTPADEAARVGAKILERATAYFMEDEEHEFNDAMCGARDDFLIAGRGQCRVNYNAAFEKIPQKIYLSEDEMLEVDDEVEVLRDQFGLYRMSEDDEKETIDKKAFEEAYLEHVYWRDFLHSDGQCWSDVWWCAFGSWLTREDLVEQFGEEIGNDVPVLRKYDDEYRKEHFSTDDDAYEDCARVWEFWSKRTGKVYKTAENYHDFLEEPIKDPYGLEGFFPCPRPVYMIKTGGSLEPVPEYKMYEDQAMELNIITGRLESLTDSLALRGVYDASLKDTVEKLFSGPETRLMPAENFSQAAQQAGGADRLIMFAPNAATKDVIAGLLVQRDKNMQIIWEVVGMSDILRGSTNPRESGKAQQLKLQMVGGNRSRMGNKQKRMQRFSRDCIRLMAEVIAELFSEETLSAVSGVPPSQDLGMDKVVALLRRDKLRGFNIDVESDSTVAPDEMREQQELAEFMGALTPMIAAVGQATQGGGMNPQAGMQLIMYMAKHFRAGRDVEDIIEQAFQQDPNKQKDPAEEAKAMETQIKLMKLEMDKEEAMVDNMLKAEEIKIKWAKLGQDGHVEMAKLKQKSIEAMINQQTAAINAQGGNAKK